MSAAQQKIANLISRRNAAEAKLLQRVRTERAFDHRPTSKRIAQMNKAILALIQKLKH
jgi:hypothetical protein